MIVYVVVWRRTGPQCAGSGDQEANGPAGPTNRVGPIFSGVTPEASPGDPAGYECTEERPGARGNRADLWPVTARSSIVFCDPMTPPMVSGRYGTAPGRLVVIYARNDLR